MKRIPFLDSHTGGEPTRLITAPPFDLGTGSVADKISTLKKNHDDLRRTILNEPRGSDVLVGALLVPPNDPTCQFGVIFFNNVGYLGMCGHGAIGVIETLRHLGRIGAGVHRLDTPVGTVACTLHDDGRVSVQNVPAFRWIAGACVEVPGLGSVSGDVAWGGNWFFLTDWTATPIVPSEVDALTDTAWRIRLALQAQHVTGRDGAEIDHIELFGASDAADSRSFVLCPGKAYDRSPCGTGTSAKLACLAADGRLQPGQLWRQQSVVGSVFEAHYQWRGDELVPTITGRAHVCAEARLLLDAADPFCWGIG